MLPGIRPLVCFVVCMRMLVYGDCANRLDEGLQMSESATSKSLKPFCGLLVEKFPGYLNKCPTTADKTRVLELMERRGFQDASHLGIASTIFGRIALWPWQDSTRERKGERQW